MYGAPNVSQGADVTELLQTIILLRCRTRLLFICNVVLITYFPAEELLRHALNNL